MSHSKKGGLASRRACALDRLEKQYEAFKAAGVDKAPRVTHKWVNGRSVEVHHPGRSFDAECKRMKAEIDRLKKPKNLKQTIV